AMEELLRPAAPQATDDWPQVSAAAERLEQAWEGAADVALEALLPPPDDPLRRAVLIELIKTDLEIRCRRRLRPRLEDYGARFPELVADGEPPVELVYEEYWVRQRHGDRPELLSYRERFPRRFSELLRRTLGGPLHPGRAECSSPPRGRPPVADLENVIL